MPTRDPPPVPRPGGPLGDLVRELVGLREARRTGVLSIVLQEVATDVLFREGAIVGATERGTPGEALGRLLVRTHVLSREQHAKVIDQMAAGGESKRFGEVAIGLGFLTDEALAEALVEQVRWRIVRALLREGVTWTFTEKPAEAGASASPLSLEGVVLDVARWLRMDQRRALLRSAGSKFALLAGDGAALAARFAMTTDEAAALVAFDGTATLVDLVGLEPSAAGADVSALAVALLLTGDVSLLDAPPAGAKPSLRPAPTTPSRPPPNERVARTLGRLKKARSVPAPDAPVDRRPESERDQRLIAEQSFLHGLAHLRANRLDAAVPFFRRAFGLMPRNLEYELYAMWVEVRVHETPPTAAQLAALRNIALAAMRQDPNLAFSYFVLGQVTLHEGGSEAIAKHHFVHALKLDPEAIDAERHIRILKRKEGSGSRFPQVRGSTVPVVPPATESSPVARVALKKVSLSPAKEQAVQEIGPPAATESKPVTDVTETPVVLYRKMERTLELPPEVLVPPPSSPVVEVAEPASPSAAPVSSPLPSSLTAVARPSEGEAAPAKVAAAAPTAKPAAAKSSATLYAGAAMTLGVLAAAFAMLSLRATGAVTRGPGGEASVSATVKAPPPVSLDAPPRPSVSSTPVAAAADAAVAATRGAGDASAPRDAAPVPVDAALALAIPASDAGRADAATPAVAPTTPSAAGMGLVILPKWASQRRVFVDGQLVGNSVEQLEVKCGAREIQIGKSGKPRTLEVPCGGIATW